MEYEIGSKLISGADKTMRPNVTTYNRLVRDRIPEIIESAGNIAVWHELDDESFSHALLQTVVRSSQQFADHESIESLCDLLDSIDAWLELQGLTMDEVSRARAEKRKRCGTFERRLFLEQVADGEDFEALPRKGARC